MDDHTATATSTTALGAETTGEKTGNAAGALAAWATITGIVNTGKASDTKGTTGSCEAGAGGGICHTV